jgi:hypothetical protein
MSLRWLKARERELLPTRDVHAVFTLPQELAPLALQNKRLIYNCSFTPVPRRCWRLLATRDILELISASSACFTPGISVCSFILISIERLPPAASLRIMRAGSPPDAQKIFVDESNPYY